MPDDSMMTLKGVSNITGEMSTDMNDALALAKMAACK